MALPLVLASTSTYRQALLTRLGVAFTTDSPQVDESRLASESPRETAWRLSALKAQAVAARHPAALIIGSDQVASLAGSPLGKPGSHHAAVEQLQAMRGHEVIFHTGISLLNSATGHIETTEIPTTVRIRNLTDQQITAYLHKEQPYDCAGSAKSEALGIAIMDSLSGDDPTALIGLPLITLTQMLYRQGLDVLMAV